MSAELGDAAAAGAGEADHLHWVRASTAATPATSSRGSLAQEAVLRNNCGMGWATGHIAKLRAGETACFRPRGNSMVPKIHSGDLCTVEPVDHTSLAVGDIVLCKVNGNEYLHLVKAIQGTRYQIGNNRGLINGWIGPNAIFGKLTKVEK